MQQWSEQIQKDFPYRDGWVYLQSAGTGLAFPGAAQATGQYYLDVARLGCDAQPLWQKPVASAKTRAARLLGVSAEMLGFFRNTSEVINIAANSIQLSHGDEVIVFSDEYPCNVLPWEQVTSETGARLTKLSVAHAGEREDLLLEAMTTATRVVSISHVHPWTGTLLNLERLGKACREQGALLVVDGIQALGAVPVDLSYADVYGAGVFKWLMSGFGTALGFFGERAREHMRPVFRSYANPAPSSAFDYAAPNIPGLYVLDATLEYLEGLGWQHIYAQVDRLAGAAHDVLSDRGITPVTPPDRRAGIISFEWGQSAETVAAFYDQQVSVSDKMGRILVSPHFYNTDDCIGRFAEALDAVIK